jgi:hypothetical protein
MYESRGKTYNPSADGFVFTEQEIARAIQSRTRGNLAKEAYRTAAEWPEKTVPRPAPCVSLGLFRGTTQPN